ncbi:ATP-dependent DNA ligase [Streptomyces violascens]|uniref:ATP-dependent DNA ligase n=1 Tax=Streptomyces violascens TaxID=67381 RepID=UPI0036CC34D9
MLATPGVLPAVEAEHLWAAESKADGQRSILYLPGDGTLVLRSRSEADITPAYPELHLLAEALGGRPAVLDGEIVALDDQGRPDFERLQPRMALAGSPAKAARLARDMPAHLVLFDVMFLNGRSLLATPYAERRAELERLDLRGPNWSTPAAIVGHSAQALAATREHHLEGLVLKRLNSVYTPGVRSKAWIKIRNVQTVDAIIGGWVPGRGRLAGLPGALLLGERHGGALHFIGSVGTGWSERERVTLAELLSMAAIGNCPFDEEPAIEGARWVLPRLVSEVRYVTRTRAGLLRHPSWHRLRPDLAPEDVE